MFRFVRPPTQRRRTIRAKLTRLVLLPLLLAAASVTGVSAFIEADRQAANEARGLRATAAVLAAAAAEATVTDDRFDAFKALRSIAQLEDVTYARIEREDGSLLVETGRGARLRKDAELSEAGEAPFWTLLTSRSVQTTAPIFYGRQPVGRIVMLSKTDGLLGTLFGQFAITLMGVSIAALLGLLVAWREQRKISGPVTGLTRTVAAVRESHDYTRVAEVQSDDEIGELVEGFNAMLGEIRTRDRAIAEHLEGLEQQVADRTAELRVAKDVAETATAAKSEFLASMSHEIRTPMNGIMVMAEMLAASEMPAKQRRYADVIAKSGSSLLAIINDILDFSKIESGKMDLEAIPVDLAEIAEDVASLFWERARGKGLDLAVWTHPALPAKVAGDPVRLRQILANLVNNALKFTETGGVLIKLEPGPNGVVIAVQDTGIGIPQNKLATLFEAFSQVDQSTTRKYGGTGLGLAICKKLVDAMDGRLWVKSAPGRGSVFGVDAPLAVLEAAEPWPRLDGAARVGVTGPSSRFALKRYLAEAGAEEADGGLVFGDAGQFADEGLRGAPGVCVADFGDARPARLAETGAVDAVLVQPIRRADVRALLEALRDGRPLEVAATAAPTAAVGGALPCFEGARVLVADDSAVNREVALEALSRLGIQAASCDDGLQALEAATRERFDLILMDGSMPEMDGFEATRAIRAHEAATGAPRTAIVALTAHVVGTAADAWRDSGMDGVLHKPFTLTQLAEVCGRHLIATGVMAEVAEPTPAAATPAPAATAADDLLDAKVRADLTAMSPDGAFLAKIEGLYRGNAAQSAAAIAAAVDRRDPDALGRAAHALKSMSYNLGAKRVAALCGKLEERSRVSGEVDAALAHETLAALQATLAALGDPALLGDPMLAALRKAIAADELELVYQAQYDRNGSAVVGAEALVRWRRDGEPVSPAVFIPLAEKNGLIPALTDRVLARLCKEAIGLTIPVAFNASALEMSKPDFVGRVQAHLDASGYPAARLEVEITETAVIEDAEQVDANIAALRALGCKVALDDFGAGYTSLSHLRRHAFDKLKIDREFIVDCEKSQSATIIHAVCSIGRALGMKVVAEGVETEGQREFLRLAGVHAMQGYLFARPEPLEALRTRLGAGLAQAA